jgi:hypothetical protein
MATFAGNVAIANAAAPIPDWAAVFNPDGSIKDLNGGIDAVYLQENISAGVATDMSALDPVNGLVFNGAVTSAHDLGNTYAYATRDTMGNLIIAAAVERLTSAENTFVEFEFNQGVVGVTSGTPWPIVGSRTANDLLVRLNFSAGNISSVDLMKWAGSSFITIYSAPAPAQTGCFVVSADCDFCNGSPISGLPATNTDIWDSSYQVVQVPNPNGFAQISINAGNLLGPGAEFTSIVVRTPEDIVLGSFQTMGYWSVINRALAAR